MKLSILLSQRRALLRQARLAAYAFAYWKLDECTRRIARAGIRGGVRLTRGAPDAPECFPTLTAIDGSQSVLEEHFTDEDIIDLADSVALATGEGELDATFRIETLSEAFLPPLRLELERGGVDIDRAVQPVE